MSTPTTVQRIGTFAYDARASHLTPQSRALFKRNILDSLGCAIEALIPIRAEEAIGVIHHVASIARERERTAGESIEQRGNEAVGRP